MTTNEQKLIKQALKPFAESGLLSAATLKAITEVKEDGKTHRPDLISRPEAAKLLGVTGRTLINWEESGDLRPIKLAGKRLVRYHFEDVQALLSETSSSKEV